MSMVKVAVGDVVSFVDDYLLVNSIDGDRIVGFSKKYEGELLSCDVLECVLQPEVSAQSVVSNFSNKWWRQFDSSEQTKLNIKEMHMDLKRITSLNNDDHMLVCMIDSGMVPVDVGSVIEFEGDYLLVHSIDGETITGFSKNHHGEWHSCGVHDCVLRLNVSSQSVVANFSRNWWHRLSFLERTKLNIQEVPADVERVAEFNSIYVVGRMIGDEIVYANVGSVFEFGDDYLLACSIDGETITGFSKNHHGELHSCRVSECFLRPEVSSQSVVSNFSSVWWRQCGYSERTKLNIREVPMEIGSVVEIEDDHLLVWRFDHNMITGFSKKYEGELLSYDASKCFLRPEVSSQSVLADFSSKWWDQFEKLDSSDRNILNIDEVPIVDGILQHEVPHVDGILQHEVPIVNGILQIIMDYYESQ